MMPPSARPCHIRILPPRALTARRSVDVASYTVRARASVAGSRSKSNLSGLTFLRGVDPPCTS